MSELFPVTEEMIKIFKEHYKTTPESLQNILLILKQKGITQMQSVRLLMSEMKLSLADADNIVLNARAWADEKEGNTILRENFFNALFSEKLE